MKILRLFLRYSPRPVMLAAAVGALGGALSAALMAVINGKLNHGQAGTGQASLASFCALVLVVLGTNYGARALMLRLATRSAADLRLSFCRQILALPLRSFEELGRNRFLASLTEDISALCQALLKVPELCVNLAMVAGCLTYLAYLSPAISIFLLLYILMGIATTRLPEAKAKRTLALSREHSDELMRLFGALASGIKSLKLHAARRRAFVDQLLTRTVDTVRRLTFSGQHTYALSQSWGQVLYFVFIGAILYGLQGTHQVSQTVLIGYTLTVLYMRPPTIALLDMMPDFGRARVALGKIESLGLSLETLSRTPEEGPVPLPRPNAAPPAAATPQRIDLVSVTHRYYHEGTERQFELGPIDLAIAPGEMLFLVGGNGSGKTTLAKLITGLYRPEHGEIRRGGATVTAERWEDYRQDFAAVFSDFFLFESLLGLESAAGGTLDDEARRLLVRLQLDHKVSVADGVLSTTRLSQGQQKRLALLTAYLEDRPIYLFDEWAADQDPHFKRVFYTELLPRLRDSGKTVIVISHDDRYYHVADRIVKLEDGRISAVSASQSEAHEDLARAAG